jgi:hypothetical protein
MERHFVTRLYENGVKFTMLLNPKIDSPVEHFISCVKNKKYGFIKVVTEELKNTVWEVTKVYE